MQKKLTSLLILLATLFIVGCQEDVPAPYPVPKNLPNKTIFVYMPWSAARNNETGSLYNNFLQNIKDIEAAIESEKGLGRNKLMVFIATSANNAVLIEVKYAANGRCQRDTLQHFDSHNMPAYTTANGLASLLSKVKVEAPAKQYALIVGCHGTGWLFSEGKSRARTRYFGGSDHYFQTNIPTLAAAIEQAKMRMQFVMFDDCYMSNVEVAYEMRHATDYLIGCCSEIMAYGMPYKNIWKHLTQPKPNYKEVVNEFHNFYSNYKWPYGNIGVTDCSKVEEVAARMKTINAATANNAKLIDWEDIQRLDGYTKTIFFDMGDYVNKLCNTPETQSMAREMQTALAQLVPYKSTTKYIYTALEQLNTQTIFVNAYSGITISDPTQSDFENALTTKRETGWWKATH
ncbi:clostripain-related cysteine peptidase [Hoylesella loescheii]|uniref:clostripain-related cysteine peptidase n=1 Tax=Hoylesella loescheii TaxID=840 RepID=UPI0026ED5B9F|nr:clostripain-related cysteine peptidase [Hoylesella loescheii]